MLCTGLENCLNRNWSGLEVYGVMVALTMLIH
ncbi:unnamed protein product [Staurois parvus]|uniref:Uncharacterized protein n=1 Tax=Staurois parvus TaxID=386267 RepID=A0ABN9FF14_9NEOB|nr:unnamed protein product [Staurois parvus]